LSSLLQVQRGLELVRGPANLAHHATEGPRGLGQSLGTQEDEEEQEDDRQLTETDAGHVCR